MSLVLYEVCPWSFWCTYRSSRQASWTVLYQDAACKQAATGIWSYPWLKAHTHIHTHNYSNTFIQKHSFKYIRSNTFNHIHTKTITQIDSYKHSCIQSLIPNIQTKTFIHIQLFIFTFHTNILTAILIYTRISLPILAYISGSGPRCVR